MIRHRELYVFTGLAVFGIALHQVQVSLASSESQITARPVSYAMEPSPQATLDPASAEAKIARELEELVNAWTMPLIQAPGWLHVVEHHDRSLDDAGELPNGQPIPIDYLKDAWYLLDGQGAVVTAVVWMRDTNGTLSQEAAYVDGTWSNLTTGESLTVGDFSLSLDFGLSESAARAPAWYNSISRDELSLDGRQALLFSIQVGVEREVNVDELVDDLGVTSIVTRAYFSPSTGDLLAHETLGIDASGEEHSLNVVRFLTLERDFPPGEVLTLLKQVSQ